MLPKFSVRKPLTVFVAVVLVIVLGIVSYLNMTPSLFPNLEFPYIIIITTYIGASPEEVEATVTRPLEQTMATLDDIKEITSSSSENYSMVTIEFEDIVNMDTVTVDLNSKLTQLTGSWDEKVGSPYIMKINPNMLPVAIVAVSKADSTIFELSDFTKDVLQNKLEGINGVASVSVGGIVEQSVQVVLSEDKIKSVNDTVQTAVKKQFADAEKELDDAKTQLDDGLEQAKNGKEDIEKGKELLDEQHEEIASQLASAEAEISSKEKELLETKLSLVDTIADLTSQKEQLTSALSIMKEVQKAMHSVLDRRDALQKDYDELKALQDSYSALQLKDSDLEAALSAIENDNSLSEEERTKATDEFKSSPDYTQTKASLAETEAQMNARGVTPLTIDVTVRATKSALDLANSSLDSVNTAIKELGTSFETIDEDVAKLEDGLTQIDEAITLLSETIEQLDEGSVTIKEAKTELGTQKSQAEYQMTSAATDLKITENTVNSTITQLEQSQKELDEGIKQLNETKKQTLEQADITNTITMDMISQILTAQNFSMPAGYLTGGDDNMLVRVGDKFTQTDDLTNLLLVDLGIDDVDPIYLSDVSDISIADNSDEIYAKLNGDNGVMVSFTMQSNAATAEVSDNIHKALTKLTKEYPDLSFTFMMDQGDYIHLIVNSVLSNLVWGGLFAIIILLFFLRDIRPTLIIAFSIPVSVIFAIVLMYFSGISLNLISLSGLAVGVGMLVDNSVVVIENIYRLRNNGATPIQAAVSGAVQVTGAIIASTLTTVAVFLPIVFVHGLTRTLFQDMALTIGYSLLASLIAAITLVPAMAQGMLKKQKKSKKEKGESKLFKGYRRIAAFTLDHKALLILGSIILLVGSAYLSIAMGFSYMPSMESTQISVNVTMPDDADFDAATKTTDEILKRLDTVDDINTVGAVVGSNVLSSISIGGGGDDTAVSLYVILNDENKLTRPISEICAEMEEKCADLDCEVSVDPSGMGDMMSMMTGEGISINVFCDNFDTLQEAATMIADTLDKVDGAQNAFNGIEETTRELRISVDKEKAMKKGLTVAQVFMDISGMMTSEKQATLLETGSDSLTVQVVDGSAKELTEKDIRDHVIETTDMKGEKITAKLSDIATITEADSLNNITRIDQKRYLNVTADVADGYNSTNVANAAKAEIDKLSLPDGVTYELTGSYETTMDAVIQLGEMLLLAVVFIYLIMVAQFQSLLSPFIIMFTIPLAFTGGFIALIIAGLDMSVIAIIGFIMMAGIIVNNGIVLVDYINQLRAEGMAKRDALIEAGVTRMRPIFMTALTTILGLSVMALNNDSSSAMMQPIALVCIGGLIYATIMTLFVVPAIYDILNKKEIRVIDKKELEIIED